MTNNAAVFSAKNSEDIGLMYPQDQQARRASWSMLHVKKKPTGGFEFIVHSKSF